MNKTKILNDYEKISKNEKIKKSHVNSFKSNTNREMERDWDSRIKEYCIGKTKNNNILDTIYWLSIPQLHNLNSVSKKLKTLLKDNQNNSADTSHIEKSLLVLSEYFEFEKMHNDLKNKIINPPVKEIEKKEKVRPSFRKAKKTTEKINKFLYKELEKTKLEMVKKYVDSFKSILDDFLLIPEEKRKSSIWQNYYIGRSESVFIIKCFTNNGMPIDNLDDKMKNDAEDAVKLIIDTYVLKQSSKLSGVLKNMPEPSSINIETEFNNEIDGKISLSFEDGRSFELRSKLVISQSVKGNLFTRYPSTFHNIKNEDGKIVSKMMSEVDIELWSKKESSYNFETEFN